MTTSPLKLVGDTDHLRDRLIVQLELDPQTGEVVAISGDPRSLRGMCGMLGRESDRPSSTGGRWTDEEVRERARPANILAALQRERTAGSAGLRLAD